jgi:tRNA(Ile)-lysidine synthase
MKLKGLVDTAAATAAAHEMFSGGAPVVAMVSGGADSVALLRALESGGLGDVSLSVLHVDHQLRGSASDGDAAFVRALCDSLGVPCRIASVDVAAYAREHGLNLEDAGRRVRYHEADVELDARCALAGADPEDGRIVTAHTFDDRAETVLMRLAQGAGVAGLLALPYRRGRIVRPLLDCTRADVVAYLGELGQAWREDATNLDTSRLRARVRADLLPVLREISPRFDDALARTLTVLGDEDELLDQMARALAEDVVEFRDGEVRLDRAQLAPAPRALMRRVLRNALFEAFPEASRLEFEHIEAVCDGVADAGFARDLPGGLRAFSEYGTLMISRDAGPAEPLAPCLLPVPGTADLGRGGTITALVGDSKEPGSDVSSALIDADAVRGPLLVTSPQPGDRMRPFGMPGSRKLQDVLTDAKVPARQRACVPVVRDGERIVWVAGVKTSEDYRVCPASERTIRLTWHTQTAEGTTW